MSTNRTSLRTASRIGLALAAATAVSAPAMAQDSAQAVMSAADVQDLPPEMQSAPVQSETTETTVGPDGVETVIRTRRIERPVMAHSDQGYPHQSYAPGAYVVERDQWIQECERRTHGRSEKDKGGIIGGLLGAVAGGIIGNRVAGDGDRLRGTLIGAGAGGLGGYALGNLVGGGKKGDRYDCQAALDSYLSQYGHGPARFGHRAIPAAGFGYPAHAYPGFARGGCGCNYPGGYSYYYAPPQQIVYVPIRYEQQQRVIVRETVREETYEVPGKARIIEKVTPAPSPKMIKQPRKVVPAPRPAKLIKQ